MKTPIENPFRHVFRRLIPPRTRRMPIALACMAAAGLAVASVDVASPSRSAANACGPDWSVVPGPALTDAALSGVWPRTSADAWAVGYAGDRTLAERWDGSAWAVVPTPNVGSFKNALRAVSGQSQSDVWAVGSYFDGSATRTLIEHWDGSSWSVVASPSPGAAGSALRAVLSVSPDDAWAAGRTDDGRSEHTLIEHWDGTRWSVVSSPNPGTGGNALNALAPAESGGVWAAGAYETTALSSPLIERWDGAAWSVASTPRRVWATLSGVASSPDGQPWAVGNSQKTLIERWDGSRWTVVPSPNDAGGANRLHGVAAVASADAWAVGTLEARSNKPILLHWDGSGWSAVVAPKVGNAALLSVEALPSGEVWAVGTRFVHGMSAPLLAHLCEALSPRHS